MPLTDVICKNARCPEGKTRARYADSGGLYLEALPAGGKHWRWKYRFAGKEKRLAIGTYPTVTLAEARQARDAARRKLLEGLDPVQVKFDARLAVRLRLENNFEAVARAWFEHWKGPRTARHSEYVLLGQRNRDGSFQTQHDRESILSLIANQLSEGGLDREARLNISRELGHEREQITAVYLGR